MFFYRSSHIYEKYSHRKWYFLNTQIYLFQLVQFRFINGTISTFSCFIFGVGPGYSCFVLLGSDLTWLLQIMTPSTSLPLYNLAGYTLTRTSSHPTPLHFLVSWKHSMTAKRKLCCRNIRLESIWTISSLGKTSPWFDDRCSYCFRLTNM